MSNAYAMKSDAYTHEYIRKHRAKEAYLLCIKDIVFKQHNSLCVKIKEVLTQPLLFQEFKAILNAKELQDSPENKTLFSIVHNILYIQSKESLMAKGMLISMSYPQHPEFRQDHIEKTKSISQDIATFVRTTQSPEYYNKWQNYMAAIHKARSSHCPSHLSSTEIVNMRQKDCSQKPIEKNHQESTPSVIPMPPRINSNISKQTKIQDKKDREELTSSSTSSPERFKKPDPRRTKKMKYDTAAPSSCTATEYYSPTPQKCTSSPILEDEALIQSYYNSPINAESTSYNSPHRAKPSPTIYYSPSEGVSNSQTKQNIELSPTLAIPEIDDLILTFLDQRETEKICLAPSVHPETALPTKHSNQKT